MARRKEVIDVAGVNATTRGVDRVGMAVPDLERRKVGSDETRGTGESLSHLSSSSCQRMSMTNWARLPEGSHSNRCSNHECVRTYPALGSDTAWSSMMLESTI